MLKRLDEDCLARLSSDYGLANLELTTAGTENVARLALTGITGQKLGTLAWTPMLPGAHS